MSSSVMVHFHYTTKVTVAVEDLGLADDTHTVKIKDKDTDITLFFDSLDAAERMQESMCEAIAVARATSEENS